MSILPGYAADDGFKAPAEWDEHEQTWMGFPQVKVLLSLLFHRDLIFGEKMLVLPKKSLLMLPMLLPALSL